MIKKDNSGVGHLAKASSHSLPISTKHSIEISRNLRYKSTSEAKKILEQTISLKKAIPFRRFNKDVGHKKGMMSGRYPIKAASAFLKLILSVEDNAQDIGLNVENLKISKILANKASSPATGGRTKGISKKSNLQIEVVEFKVKKVIKRQTGKKVVDKKAEDPKVKVEAKKETIPSNEGKSVIKDGVTKVETTIKNEGGVKK